MFRLFHLPDCMESDVLYVSPLETLPNIRSLEACQMRCKFNSNCAHWSWTSRYARMMSPGNLYLKKFLLNSGRSSFGNEALEGFFVFAIDKHFTVSRLPRFWPDSVLV